MGNTCVHKVDAIELDISRTRQVIGKAQVEFPLTDVERKLLTESWVTAEAQWVEIYQTAFKRCTLNVYFPNSPLQCLLKTQQLIGCKRRKVSQYVTCNQSAVRSVM